MTICLDRGLG